jgi:Zn-dependent oligopeptidase
VLQEMNRYRLVVERRDDLAGLPDQAVTAAAETAEQAGMKGKWVFTLHHPSLWPFLKNADNRELRRKIFTAYTTLGNHDNAADNKATLARIAALRAEKARPLGYGTWADYLLEEHMAKTPASVYGFLDRLWPAARQMAEREAGVLQAAIRADGGRLYSSRTIGSTTRKRCAGAISISTSPLCVPTSRSTYFQHIFGAESGYSSGYYSYIWAEMLDADAFALFKERGLFDSEMARSFRTNVLEKGGTADVLRLYVRFRGREPDVTPMLTRRGFVRP